MWSVHACKLSIHIVAPQGRCGRPARFFKSVKHLAKETACVVVCSLALLNPFPHWRRHRGVGQSGACALCRSRVGCPCVIVFCSGGGRFSDSFRPWGGLPNAALRQLQWPRRSSHPQWPLCVEHTAADLYVTLTRFPFHPPDGRRAPSSPLQSYQLLPQPATPQPSKSPLHPDCESISLWLFLARRAICTIFAV